MKPLILLITSTLVIMADFTLSPVLPRIKEAFADTQNIDLLVKFVLTTPALFIVLSSPLIGYLCDKYGRKCVVRYSILVYVITGTAGYFANTIYEILLTRAIFGVSVTGVITGCSALITDNYHGKDLNRMMGLQSAFIGYSGLVYMILGGILGDISWRASFLVYLLPLVLLVLFTIYWGGPCTVQPAEVDIRPFRLKKYWKIYLGAFFLMVFFYMIPLQIPFYLQTISPLITNTNIALTLAAVSLCSATTSLFYKYFRDRFSYRILYVVPFALMGLGYVMVSWSSDYFLCLLGLILAGIAMGLIIPNLRVWVGAISDITTSGRAFGGLTTCFYLGQVVSPPLIAAIGGNFTIAGILVMVLASLMILRLD